MTIKSLKLSVSKISACVAAAGLLFWGSASHAGVITAGQQPGRCLCAPNGLGQSFMAEDAYVTLGVYIGDANVHLNPSGLSMTLKFLEGDGPSGTELFSSTFTPVVSGGYALNLFDISSIPLTVGNMYSFFITSVGGRGAIQVGYLGTNPYAGGRAFEGNGSNHGGAGNDMGFVVTPVAPPASAVPVPGTLALLGLGLIGLAGHRRKAKLA